MGRNKDIYSEPKTSEIKKLKAQLRKKDHEISRLKSELRTLEKAFNSNIIFLREKTNDVSLEDLVKGAENDLNLKQIKDDNRNKFSELQKKWKCYQCEDGILKLIIVPGNENSRYFRKCSVCSKRTDIKELTDDVDKTMY